MKFDLIKLSKEALTYDEIKMKFGYKIDCLNFNLVYELCNIYADAYSDVDTVNKTSDYQDLITQMNSFRDTVKTKSEIIKKLISQKAQLLQ